MRTRTGLTSAFDVPLGKVGEWGRVSNAANAAARSMVTKRWQSNAARFDAQSDTCVTQRKTDKPTRMNHRTEAFITGHSATFVELLYYVHSIK